MQQKDFSLRNLLRKLLYLIPNAEVGSIVLNDGYISKIILASSNTTDTSFHTIQDFTQLIIPSHNTLLTENNSLNNIEIFSGFKEQSNISTSQFKAAKEQIVFPLVFKRKIIGEIQLENHKSENIFTERDVELVARSSKIINLLFHARINQTSLSNLLNNIISANNIILKSIDSDVNKLKNIMQIITFILEMNVKNNPKYSQILNGLYALEETRSAVLEQTLRPISNNVLSYSIKESLVESFPYIKIQSPQIHSIVIHAKGNSGKSQTDTKIYLGKKLFSEDQDVLQNYKKNFPLIGNNGSNIQINMDWYSFQKELNKEEELIQTDEFFFNFAISMQDIILDRLKKNNNIVCHNLKSQEIIMKNMLKPFFRSLRHLEFDKYSLKWQKSLKESDDILDSLLYFLNKLIVYN